MKTHTRVVTATMAAGALTLSGALAALGGPAQAATGNTSGAVTQAASQAASQAAPRALPAPAPVSAVPRGVRTRAAAAAPVTLPDLYARAGSTTLPDGTTVPVWGYSDSAAGTVDRPGGPTLEVTEGDVVTITLNNELGEASGLLFQGQEMVPDRTGAPAAGTKTYTFTADHAGTFLYEAALLPNAQHQVAMGLYGALVVRPATAGRAYDAPETAYDSEAVLLLGEVDPALNGSANPALFDLRDYKPTYYLINGTAYPDTGTIAADAGTTVLLRYVNGGLRYHSMAVLGAGQDLIGVDGSALNFARHYVAETFGPGQTADTLVTTPSTQDGVSLPVYDGSFLLANGSQAALGGMLTTIDVAADASLPGGDTVGPVTSQVAYDGTDLTAELADATSVEAAEYFVDTVGAEGSGTTMAVTPGASVTVSEPLTPPAGQQHVLYVRGYDGTTWGPVSSFLFTGVDQTGPTTRSPSLTPRLSNGASSIAVSATADDTATGGSDVLEAEYFIGSTDPGVGNGVAMTVNKAAPVASIDGTITPAQIAALAVAPETPEGAHIVWIRSRDTDALGGPGIWGTAINTQLTIDLTGPTIPDATDAIMVDPDPTNGRTLHSSGLPIVRVSVPIMEDPVSGGVNSSISRAELFIDTVGTDGSGVPLQASDGVFNDSSEGGYTDIPLTTIRQLSDGVHTVSVHARDAAGNWGDLSTASFTVDKTGTGLLAFSTQGNRAPLGFAGQANRAVIYRWTDSGRVAATNLTAKKYGIPRRANVDGYSAGGNGTFFVSFASTVRVKGVGKVRDEDVLKRTGNGWKLWFDGSKRGLGKRIDLGASSVTGGKLYFSVANGAVPPGVTGPGDDADVYRWNGKRSYTRVFDASAAGLPASATVDGISYRGRTLYLSFAGTSTSVPGLGVVQDEDVVRLASQRWSLYFDGTNLGLDGSGALDVDAFDVP